MANNNTLGIILYVRNFFTFNKFLTMVNLAHEHSDLCMLKMLRQSTW